MSAGSVRLLRRVPGWKAVEGVCSPRLGSGHEYPYLPCHRPGRLRRAERRAARRARRPAFTFRFLDSGEAEEDILEATGRAEESARAWLEQRGYGYKNLRSTAEDLSQAPLGKRQRREAARKSF